MDANHLTNQTSQVWENLSRSRKTWRTTSTKLKHFERNCASASGKSGSSAASRYRPLPRRLRPTKARLAKVTAEHAIQNALKGVAQTALDRDLFGDKSKHSSAASTENGTCANHPQLKI